MDYLTKLAGFLSASIGAFIIAYFIWFIPTIKDITHFWVAIGELFIFGIFPLIAGIILIITK